MVIKIPTLPNIYISILAFSKTFHIILFDLQEVFPEITDPRYLHIQTTMNPEHVSIIVLKTMLFYNNLVISVSILR